MNKASVAISSSDWKLLYAVSNMNVFYIIVCGVAGKYFFCRGAMFNE
jgi:hypothetical protein